jgi:hypothetical protein
MLQMPFKSYIYTWPAACLPAAFFSAVILFSSRCALGPVMFLVWMQVVVYLLQQAEEHFWPGGFKTFINKQLFKASDTATPLTDLDVFLINIPIIWILFPLTAVAAQHIDLALGSFLPVFGVANAVTHVAAWVIKRCYNPGLVVSLLLNIPTGFYTLKTMLDAKCVTYTTLLVMVGISVAIHLGMVLFAFAKSKQKK